MPVRSPRSARASTATLIPGKLSNVDDPAGFARITGSIMSTAPSVSLETIVDEPLRFDFELPFEVEALDREPLVAISPVRIAGEVARVEGGHALMARLAWTGDLECSRCLSPYSFFHDEEFSLLLYPRGTAPEGEITLERDDLDAHFYDDPVVPIAPIAEERIQMSVPMKPLCREDCRGLCPNCGVDRNVTNCECAREAEEIVDPRWKALELLKKE
jgi:uncharacterized protein